MSKMSTDRPGRFAWLLLATAVLAACQPAASDESDRPETARTFPRADRPVAGVVSNEFSNEEARDDRNEATKVMDLAGITPGMTVADIGAGNGYYTVRLAERVGAEGRSLGDPQALRRARPRRQAARRAVDGATLDGLRPARAARARARRRGEPRGDPAGGHRGRL